MKKIPTYTLIRRPLTISGEGEYIARAPKSSSSGGDKSRSKSITSSKKRTVEKRTLEASSLAIRKQVSDRRLQEVYSNLNENFRATLRSSHGSTSVNDRDAKVIATASDNIKKITEKLAREENVLRVGIVDMGAWIGQLPKLLERLNAAQTTFTIFEVMAPIPAGLVKTIDGFTDWAKLKMQSEDIDFGDDRPTSSQIIFDDFVIAAEDIRKGMGLDLLIGLTPHMLGGTAEQIVFANHFSATEGASSLISTADLREFSALAGRPFEAGIGMLLIATLFVTITPVGYHNINTGCIFDYNSDRISLIDSIRAMQIDNGCQSIMEPKQVKTAKSMLTTLKRMRIRITK